MRPGALSLGRVVVAGCRDAIAARTLGFVPSHGIGSALEMAHGVAGGQAAVGLLLAPRMRRCSSAERRRLALAEVGLADLLVRLELGRRPRERDAPVSITYPRSATSSAMSAFCSTRRTGVPAC